MPAPLAKGLIISLSLLFAAGIAVYENPHVRQWVEDSRRKVAIALHNLGDELAPPSGSGESRKSRESSPDASTREDESPEAVERRRRARQEILERGRLMEERRKSKLGSKTTGRSFDDIVDKDGTLKTPEDSASMTTAAEPQIQELSLRHRNTQSKAAALGSAIANPFADEMGIDSSLAVDEQQEAQSSGTSVPAIPVLPVTPNRGEHSHVTQQTIIDPQERQHATTLLINNGINPRNLSDAQLASFKAQSPLIQQECIDVYSHNIARNQRYSMSNYEAASVVTSGVDDGPLSPPIPPKPEAYQPQRLLIDTEVVSNHPSEQLLDLTPTTSTSSATADLAELNNERQISASNYWSVNEWAQSSAPPFYSSPQSEAADLGRQARHQTEGSQTGSGEHASQMGSEDMDVLSEDGVGISTPGSWTEVGSQVSEEY